MRTKQLGRLLLAGCALSITAACLLFLPPRGPVEFAPSTLPEARTGAPYEVRVSVSGNATPVINFSISEGALPPGLQLVRVEGEDAVRITGTPTSPGAFRFKLFLYCYGTNVSGQHGEKEYQITVSSSK